MKRLSCLFLAIFVIFAGCSTIVSAQQPWSNILTSNRATNWQNDGLPSSFTDKNGSNIETTANPWTPPVRTQFGSTINPSGNAATDLSNINTALASCPDGHYVLLGSGTFLIQGNVIMYRHSCSLRGSGANSTTLSFSGSGGAIQMGSGSGGGVCRLTSDSNYAAGSTSITCLGSAPPVGAVASLTQCNTGYSDTVNYCAGGSSTITGSSADNGGLYVYGDTYNSQNQTTRITSVSGTGPYTIGLSNGLYMPNWSYSQFANLTWDDATYDAIGVGLEDLTVSSLWIQMYDSYASWIKGVRILTATGSWTSLETINSVNDLVMNNYLFGDTNLDSAYYTPWTAGSTSATLFLNNIVSGNPTWDGLGRNSGNVFGYNYGRDAFTLYVEDSFYDHAAYSSFDLFEGNQTGVLHDDATHGTHGVNTFFRNYSSCYDPPYAPLNPRGIRIDPYHRFDNAVGNAIGTSGVCGTYQSTTDGAVFVVGSSDALTGTSLMRWGNVSAVQQSSDTPANSGVRFVSSEVPASLAAANTSFSLSVPANTALPCSFFLAGYSSTGCTPHPSGGTGLSWWRVCKSWTAFPTTCATSQTQPFPFAGPDVTGGPHVNGYAYDTPAAVAWANLPVDATYQNSYSISGSNWSNGTETLTISGLPSGSAHIMGAFQLSGVDSACTSGATFNANNEILMTGSSSTTVQYALPSSPGVSCTGTMRFPDVRQFDERVYEADSSTAQPAAPINLKGTVVPTP